MVKMKVTTQGEAVINLLWDAIAAKGFEKDMYFSQAAVDIRALPKLEGTVHVNIALIAKFMPNYFFNPAEYPEIGRQDHGRNDDFLFDQGSTRGLGQIRFHDYRRAFDGVELPNVRLFFEQTESFRQMLAAAPPGPDQMKDVDFLLAGRRDLRARRLCPAHPRERPSLRHRRRPARPDLRVHGSRRLGARPPAAGPAEQQRGADRPPAGR